MGSFRAAVRTDAVSTRTCCTSATSTLACTFVLSSLSLTHLTSLRHTLTSYPFAASRRRRQAGISPCPIYGCFSSASSVSRALIWFNTRSSS